MAFKALTLNTPPEQAAHILAEDDAAIYEALMGGDKVLDIGNKLAATVITNNSVRISDGVVVVGGHVGRIVKGDYEDMTIENGTSGKKRNDLICARFMVSGDIDTYKLIVVKGASGTTAVDPTIVSGNLYNGDKQRDFPLWRVCLDGLSITKVEQLFSVSSTIKYLTEKTASLQTLYNQLNSNIETVSNKYAYNTKNYNANILTFAESLADGTFCMVQYDGYSASGAINAAPSNSSGVALISKTSANFIVILAIPYTGGKFTRTKNNGTWRAWE